MKLNIDARLISSSGIGVYLQNIIQSDIIFKYDLTLLYRKADKDYFEDIRHPVKLVEYNAELYSIKELFLTSAKTSGSEVFWSPHYNVPLINFASKLKVVTIHDVFHLAYFHTLSLAQKAYAKLMINHAVKSSDLIFTVSHFSRVEILKYTGCNPEKVKVVHNGINFEAFSKITCESHKTDILNHYKIKSPYMLFVGNVKPHKNLKNALLGFRELLEGNKSRFGDFKFVIVGKREGFITGDRDINTLLTDSFYSNKVLFTGWVSDNDLPTLYQEAATFIFPSIYEGFGFPPLEAMASGCPVVSSNAACMPEVYEDAALYFDPLQPSQIGEALWKVLTDKDFKQNLISKGITQSKKFKWQNAVEEKLAFIEGLA